MTDMTEIQVFVSCPGDVDPEKQVVINVCENINETIEPYYDLRLSVKEWKSIVGHFGERPQEIINRTFTNYDIYLGIWWMRFGSKTGAVNHQTGEEFESGTHEEFVIACESLKDNPQNLLLFFKEYKSPNSNEVAQLSKLNDFRQEQQKKGWINEFQDKLDFQGKIFKLLYQRVLEIGTKKKIQQKESFLAENQNLDFNKYRQETEKPHSYISRTILHYDTFQKETAYPFIKPQGIGIVEALQTQKRIVLLGDAGAGKSTELLKLASECSVQDAPYIAVFQRLNTYTPELGIESFLPTHWSEIPEELMLIIWDGLDEIQPHQFNTAVRQMTNFAEKYPQASIVVSSRTNFYELPNGTYPGTLTGFEPYFLEDLVAGDAKNYYADRFDTQQATSFLEEVSGENLDQLLAKPFFLMLLAEVFHENTNLKQGKKAIYESFLLSRIRLDEEHYKTTYDIRNKKEEIFPLLERVALCMEILTRNTIEESELLQIVSSEEFKLIKFCTAFTKKKGEETVWQFEHNNIQEYLAARALSNQSFETVLQFLTFEPEHTRLIPSWVNTLNFLFSILDSDDDLLQNLIDWLVEYEKEIIIKFERDKVPESVRVNIFDEVFGYYKRRNIWLRSNKFSAKELARFADSPPSIGSMINQIKDPKSSRIVRINAMRILGNFSYDDPEIKSDVKQLLLKQVEENQQDSYYVFETIFTLKSADITDYETVHILMQILREEKNQYIRAAMYAILSETSLVNDYVDYLLDGFELLNKNEIEGREEVSLGDESININRAIKEIDQPDSLKKLINYITEHKHALDGAFWAENLKQIVGHAVNAYHKEPSILDSMLNWFKKRIEYHNIEEAEEILIFFDYTETREEVFQDVWELPDDRDRVRNYAIAKLLNTKLASFITEKYNKRDLTNDDLRDLIHSLSYIKNAEKDEIIEMIQQDTDFELNKPEVVDYEKIRQERQQQNFDLLFDAEDFKNAALSVFEGENKEILTSDELYEIRKVNKQYINLEDIYPGVGIDLLRDFARNSSKDVTKDRVVNWFENEEKVVWYQISNIYNEVFYHPNLPVNDKQKEWIIAWCREAIKNIDFKKAITNEPDGTTRYSTEAIYVYFFSKKFDIDYADDTLLDMLSFHVSIPGTEENIKYPVNKLKIETVDQRIIQNLEEGIGDPTLLIRHVTYVVKHELKSANSIILHEIINTNRSVWDRSNILNEFCEDKSNLPALFKVLPNAMDEIKWNIVEKLLNTSYSDQLDKYLQNQMKTNENVDERLVAAGYLVHNQNEEGVRFILEWVIDEGNVYEKKALTSLNSLKNPDSISSLIALLQITYQREIKANHFEDLRSIVINAFYNIALQNDQNFNLVKDQLNQFIANNGERFSDVNFLHFSIERMEEQFFYNKSLQIEIEEAKEKLEILS